jgi:dihydroorotase-like cyclic amidohydrolase
MMDWNNIFIDESDRQHYVMTSPTIKNLMRQQRLWSEKALSINDAVWSDHKGHEEKRKAAALIEKIKSSK